MTSNEIDMRMTPTADKYLLIFPNKQIMEWYKRYLLREDIIYMTEYEIANLKLVGLRYKKWLYINYGMTREDIDNFLRR